MVLENNFREQMFTLNATLRDPQLLGFLFGVRVFNYLVSSLGWAPFASLPATTF